MALGDHAGEPVKDTTQQATASTPETKPAKKCKRAAAGKATAQKLKLARKAQKKAAEEAAAIIANHKAAEPAPAQPEAAPAQPGSSSLTITHRLALGSLVVSLIGLYYKREEIKNAFIKTPPAQPPHPLHLLPPPTTDL